MDEYTKLQQEAIQLCLRVERVTLEYLPSEFRRVGQQELKEFMLDQAKQIDVSQLEHLEEMRQKLTEAKQQFLKLQQDLQSAEQTFNQQSRQQSGDLSQRPANQLLGEYIINDSEYLENVVVIINKSQVKELMKMVDSNDENNPFIPESYQELQDEPQNVAVGLLYLKQKKQEALNMLRAAKYLIREVASEYVEQDQDYVEDLKKQR